ncbi:LysR substrate-binding domain-containing protein [Mesorhizobium sp. ANAO-SY3R2]|uniref:LysR substrate-binding domain-containing protein n=1 Tax=Mesorhizobium sp. ANAO-SY3R2 TaxID=3166644 RepID=UPI003671F761
METRRLANFIAIVDCGSLTRAAARMNIAQPALSQQLAGLEASYGKQLVLRSRQGVTVTPAGQALYRNAQSLLRQLKQMESDIKSAGDHISGHVSIGLPVSCAPILAMPILKAVRERYPQILLQISENMSGMLGELILNNRLDIALLYGTHGAEGLLRKPVLVERLCIVSRAEFIRATPGETIAVRQLADVPLVLPSHSNGLRTLVDAAFARHGLTPNLVAEIDSLSSLRGAAGQGLAATILPRSAAGENADGLHVADIVEPSIKRTIVLCKPSAQPASGPVEAVEALIIEVINDLVTSGKWQGVTLK